MNTIFEKIKLILKHYEPLHSFYHFHITGRLKKEPTELIRRNLKKKQIFSIQIGSNDGMMGDPIYTLLHKTPNWNGLFVEPIPYLFERLKSNYDDREGLIFENAAINSGETQPFYWIDPIAKEENPDLPPWFDQLGSFKEEHIYGVPEIADILLRYRRTSEIQGLTFQQLLDKHCITGFDVLHIDTEGYDWHVLSQVDLYKYQPRIILYEYKCLPTEEKTLAEQPEGVTSTP